LSAIFNCNSTTFSSSNDFLAAATAPSLVLAMPFFRSFSSATASQLWQLQQHPL
jgi:hypothetical protein